MPENSVTTTSEIKFLATLFLLLAIFLTGSYVLNVKREQAHQTATLSAHSFPPVSLQAKAAYVYDARTQTVLFALNENTRMPLASLTKLMSALVAEELAPAYGTVTVSQESLLPDGDNGLKVGEKWSLQDLLDFSLVTSSNDGIHTVALALGALEHSQATPKEAVNDFVGKMNRKANELNLKNTYFWNESGLDESEVKGGAYGTARDIATLLNYILVSQPELLEATQKAETTFSSDKYNHRAKNTNSLANEIPGLLASKTGFTDTAGGNLAFVFDPELGRPIIVSILGSTSAGRFADARTLIAATLEYINK